MSEGLSQSDDPYKWNAKEATALVEALQVDAVRAWNVVGAIQLALAGTDDDARLRAVVAKLVEDTPIDPEATAPVELLTTAIKAVRDAGI